MPRSRAECAAIIARGQSILLPNGRVVSKLEDLPSAVDLAGDDLIVRQIAVKDLEAQRAKLDAEIKAAKDSAKEVKAEVEVPAETPPEVVSDPTAEVKTINLGRKPAA